MTVVFRADASTVIGTGHVMRCLTLAEALRMKGAQPRFISRAVPGNLIASIRQHVPVHVLPAPASAGEVIAGDRATWPGVSEATDADETVAALDGHKPDWLVVDHYALGLAWEQRLRPYSGRILVLEDLPQRAHDCDALLDQNYSDEGESRHAKSVPEHCRLLAGPRYALLAPAYARLRQTQPERDGTIRRVLVYFGGADPDNMTAQALTALSTSGLSHLGVDLVIGTNHPQREALERQAAARPGTSVHGTRPHLADLMIHTDLAVGAGGVTTWERMCLGLPALVVSLAENQRVTCEALAAAGLIEYLGSSQAVGADRIREALERLIANPSRVAELATAGRRLVDGDGASRVAGVLTSLGGGDPMRTRNALHDADACPEGFGTFSFAWIDRCQADGVLALRNTPHVREQMRSRDPIAAAQHRQFIEQYAALDRYDFVLVDDSTGRYVGVFYVTHIGSTPEIGKYIGASEYLGKGVAHEATRRLLEFCRTRTGLRQLVSMTRAGNTRNIALNKKLGFELSGGTHGDYVMMTLAL